jgi:GNAT superfamily N-acetyltransferase
MRTRDLAAHEHRNLIEAIALAASIAPGGFVRRVDGVAAIHSGIPVRLFNEVLVEDRRASDAALADAVELLRRHRARFVVNLRRGPDDARRPLMAELGLVSASPDPWMPGMGLHPISPADPAAPGPDGHRIEVVRDAAGVEAHIEVVSAGFGMPPDLVRPVLGPALLEQPAATLYVGRVDGRAVTSGLGVRSGRVIGVYDIATVPDARRRGYGAAMTARVVADGVATGCDVAVLQASDMGELIYRRMGFRTVVEYTGYIDPEAEA